MRYAIGIEYDGSGFLGWQRLAEGATVQGAVAGVIPGWTEALQLMTEGEARRFWIPKKLAYRGAPDKPEGMLVFDVELIEVVKE